MEFKLPEGWSKQPGAQATSFVLQAPRIEGKTVSGFVTVDEKQRGYALGCFSNVQPMPYSGRDWKTKLYADAADALEQAIKL